MITIKLGDGKVLEGITLERNILWSEDEITPAMFKGKLNGVVISGEAEDDDFGRVIGSHEHMELCYIRKQEGKYAFALNDIDPKEWERMQNRADIVYIAMMSGIQL